MSWDAPLPSAAVTMLIGEKSEPSEGRWMENFCITTHARMWYIYMYVPYIHNECMEDFTAQIFLKKVGGGGGGGMVVTPDLSMLKKTAADSKAQGKKPGSTCGLLG